MVFFFKLWWLTSDFLHRFQEGTAIGALELFASLVEHMARWADALGDSFGLCMLEADGTAGRPFWNP